MADIFDKFSLTSGIKMNCVKSRVMFSKGVTRKKICKTNYFDKYLGFPMFKARIRK